MSKQTAKKILAAFLIMVGFVLLKFGASLALNEALIANINNGNYSDSLVKMLYALNLEEPYIVHYNDGIRLYKLAEFKDSQAKFEAACGFPSSYAMYLRMPNRSASADGEMTTLYMEQRP